LESLRETLHEAIEMNREDALASALEDCRHETILA